ncbi:MAG TPA: ATP-dependent DNA ligase, partial [archaeon]|nr:ATP-dependent DNA ligase [archaeon]
IELGVAEKLAIRAIAVAIGQPEKVIIDDYNKTGDLGTTTEKFLIKRTQITLASRRLTIERVYEELDRIAHATGSGAQKIKIRLLTSLLNDATSSEAKYIIRMVTGRLRIGVADMTILDALAIAYGGGKEFREEIERAYNLTSDLGYVAETVAAKGLDATKHFSITVGKPVRPMLAERLSNAHDILAKLGGKGAAEYKYDGLRIQAHILPNAIQLFSRRIENITSQFPDVVKALKEAVAAKSAIVEGECVAVDPNTGEMMPFQMVSQRRGRKYEIEETAKEIPVTVFLFDVLYADERDYTVKPYPERREELKKIVKLTERVKISEQIVTNNAEELDQYMEKAITDGCEGLMLKDIGPESFYAAGARGFKWIKFKREYKSEMADTVDLVAVGAFAGRGRRAGSYGALLMAAYDPDSDTFKTVCKLGSGFTDEDLADMPKTFEQYTISHRHARVDSRIEADVWFTPAIVMEIIGAELTLSPSHTSALDTVRKGAGLAIRFPRFAGKWRKDKAPEDATTVKEIKEMYKNQLKKITVSSPKA